MLDDLDTKVDKVNIELENINIRLKKALDNVFFIFTVVSLLLTPGLCRFERAIDSLSTLFY